MAETGYIKVAYIPCNSFKRLMEWNDSKSEIMRIEAMRGIQSKTVNKSLEGLGFIKIEDIRIKSFQMFYSQAGRHGIKSFPVKRVESILKNTDIEDIAIKKIDLIIDSKEFYEKYLKADTVKKSDDSRIVFSFAASITKNQIIRNDISRFTAYEIDKLKFKYETLDLVGIFSLADRLKQQHANLLPSSNQDTKFLKEAMKLVFSAAPLRLRSYTLKGRKNWELEGTEEF